MAAPDFWNDQNAAKLVIDQSNALRAVLNPFKAVSGRLEDIRILVELAEAEADAAHRAGSGGGWRHDVITGAYFAIVAFGYEG